MEKMTKLMCILALGAGMPLLSCQREEPVEEIAEETGVRTVSVTVSAGVDNGQTKSAVVTEDGVRKLTFTEGDRLYVLGVLDTLYHPVVQQTFITYLLSGYLTADPLSISSDGTSATFSGDLEVYAGLIEDIYIPHWVEDYPAWMEEVWAWDEERQESIVVDYINHEAEGHDENVFDHVSYNFEPSTYHFSTSDPLSECLWAADAIIVHADNRDGLYINPDMTGFYSYDVIAPDVNSLMTTSLYVTGLYDSSTQGFNLTETDRAILNCTISGLAANSTYQMTYSSGAQANSFEYYCSGTVNADAEGQVRFACFGNTSPDYFHQLRFENNANSNDVRIVDLGQKSLAAKVYNITREASVMEL